MSTIEKMREVADLLSRQRKFNEAYTIYDELYRQIWSILGAVQSSTSGYSNYYYRSGLSSNTVLRTHYPEPAANVLCTRMYHLNLSGVLEEFIRIMQGHLQCIASSWQLRNEIPPDTVFNEFAVLYTLALQAVQQRKLIPVFAIATAVLDRSNRVSRIVPKQPRSLIEKLLVDQAQKGSDEKLKSINRLLLDYLWNRGDRKTDLFKKLSMIAGPSAYRYQFHEQRSERNTQYRRYEPYDRYGHYASSSRKFYSAIATEEEKNAYYGQFFGLMGKVTKDQIRSKYLDMISLYHPDRVQHLGPELKELAEIKSKEINAAYSWLKSKYQL